MKDCVFCAIAGRELPASVVCREFTAGKLFEYESPHT